MYRKKAASTPVHPYSSKWYEVPKPTGTVDGYGIIGGYNVPVLAVETGEVIAAGKLDTGFWVALDIGNGNGVAYHHLREIFVSAAVTDGMHPVVGEGTPLGILGGSPTGYGLWHLHWDKATSCKFDPRFLAKYGRLDGVFIDAGKYLATCKHLSLEEAWGDHGRVGPAVDHTDDHIV
jgi:murein DD-endopeptidase MepM/ murein hydrolase activator NlpD